MLLCPPNNIQYIFAIWIDSSAAKSLTEQKRRHDRSTNSPAFYDQIKKARRARSSMEKRKTKAKQARSPAKRWAQRRKKTIIGRRRSTVHVGEATTASEKALRLRYGLSVSGEHACTNAQFLTDRAVLVCHPGAGGNMNRTAPPLTELVPRSLASRLNRSDL
jgi:hypothetical protein